MKVLSSLGPERGARGQALKVRLVIPTERDCDNDGGRPGRGYQAACLQYESTFPIQHNHTMGALHN